MSEPQQSREESLTSIENTVKDRNNGSLPVEKAIGGEDRSSLRETKPPASNPGSDDPTGGIAAGHGGLSTSDYNPSAAVSAVNSDSTQKADVTESSDLVARFNSVLGLTPVNNSSKTDNEDITTFNNDKAIPQKAYEQATLGASAIASAAVAAVTGLFGTSTADSASNETQQADALTSSGAPTSDDLAAHASKSSVVDSDSTSNPNSNERSADLPPSSSASAEAKADSAAASNNKMSDDSAPQNPAKDESVPSSDPDAQEGGKELHATGRPPASGTEGKHSPENPSSIPTAGGIKLGKKAEGSSQVIPDLPPVENEGPGVASADGQPTTEVKDNTAANTGGATGGPGPAQAQAIEDHHKQNILDKVKNVVHKE